MSKPVAPADKAHVSAILGVMFGGERRLKTVAMIVALWVSINMTASAVYDLVQCKMYWGQLSGLVVILLVWLVIRDVARVAANLPRACITAQSPEGCRVLITFLSPPTDLTALMTLTGDITDDKVREAFARDRWRMPVEAIAHHVKAKKLETVVVIPSADAGSEPSGTWRNVDDFRRVVRRFAGSHGVDVVSLADVNPAEWAAGVAFDDAAAVLRSLRDVLQWLRAQGIADSEAIINVTGGTKLATVAGAAATMGLGLSCEYITEKYQPVSFAVGYEKQNG